MRRVRSQPLPPEGRVMSLREGIEAEIGTTFEELFGLPPVAVTAAAPVVEARRPRRSSATSDSHGRPRARVVVSVDRANREPVAVVEVQIPTSVVATTWRTVRDIRISHAALPMAIAGLTAALADLDGAAPSNAPIGERAPELTPAQQRALDAEFAADHEDDEDEDGPQGTV